MGLYRWGLTVAVARLEALARGHADVGAVRIIGGDAFGHGDHGASRGADNVEGGAEVDELRAARLDDEGIGILVDDMEHRLAAFEPGEARAVVVELEARGAVDLYLRAVGERDGAMFAGGGLDRVRAAEQAEGRQEIGRAHV